MLEALHPGRIDLGIGRAPGTDQLTARRPAPVAPARSTPTTSPSSSSSCMGYFDGAFPEGHPYAASPPCPASATGPRCGCSARATTAPRPPGCSACRSRSPTTSRRPTPMPAAGRVPGGVPALRRPRRPVRDARRRRSCAAETDERGPRGSPGPGALAFLRLRVGPARPLPDARGGGRATAFTPAEREAVRGLDRVAHRGRTRRPCARRLDELVERTGADELMVTTLTHEPRGPAGVVPPGRRGRGAGRASRPRPLFCTRRIRRVTPV